MEQDAVAWMIGGTAGEGLETAGEALASTLAGVGYLPSTQRDFPSRIRGGDTTFTVRLTAHGHLAPPADIDVALAFNDTVLPRMQAHLAPEGILLVDDGVEAPESATAFPFSQLAKEAGIPRAKNMVALGATAWLLGIDSSHIEHAVLERFKNLGEMAEKNRQAVRAGFEHAQANLPQHGQAPKPSSGPRAWMSGNEAAALGALVAGCRFAAAYPITPASEILELLTPRLQQLGGIAAQMEDEMAALQACIGAGFGGVKAITATSGPGLSLMTETIGFAASAEVPCVIVDCQRPGPSTGMPTKHGQEDLAHMISGGHGEAVRIVLAPTNVEDAFHITSEAFRLAELYRCPTFVALDQQCSLFKQAIAPPNLEAEAARHEPRPQNPNDPEQNAWDGTMTPYDGDGAPQRVPIPGESGRFYANSTEHGPAGFTTEDPVVRNATLARRANRALHIVDAMHNPLLVEGDGSRTIVSWGSTVEACREAARQLDDVRVVAMRLIWPFPREAFDAALGTGEIFVVEANATGQLARLIKSEFPLHDRLTSVLRNDGIPVGAKQIVEAVQ